MFDNILRIIWAILTASFVGLIVYFRKPLMSILHALSDMELLKAGPLEFKRRRQDLNQSFASLMRKLQSQSEISKNQEEIILGLEHICLLLSGMLLGVLHNMKDADPHLVTRVKGYRDEYYKTVKAKKPDLEGIAWNDEMVNRNALPPIEESQQSKP